VVVGPKQSLAATGVEVADLNWLCDPPEPGEAITVQMRHRATAARAIVSPSGGAGNHETPSVVMRLTFEQAQLAVTPGQSAVVFRGERVLGGGRIRRALRADPLGQPTELAALSGRADPSRDQ